MQPIFAIMSLIRCTIGCICISASASEMCNEPDWAKIAPKRVIRYANPEGTSLVKAVAALQPGDKLLIAAETYKVERMWDIRVSGTPRAPIPIMAGPGAEVVLTRSDTNQNVLNIGQGGPVKYLSLQGVEITGGSHGPRLGQ